MFVSTAGTDTTFPATRRLWSLWDMLSFNATQFYGVVTAIAGLRELIDAWGIDDADPGPKGKDRKIPKDACEKMARTHMADLTESLAALDAKVSSMAAERLIKRLNRADISYRKFAEYLEEIHSRLGDELSLSKLFVLEKDKEKYFDPQKPLFGTDFEAKFSAGAAELDEAAKCFALGRPTACVFHLMRLMEHGLRAAYLCLGNPPLTSSGDRNWFKILDTIKNTADAKTQAHNWKDLADKDFFADVRASLDTVRVAWRNSTMHVENTYTDDQAEHIFGAVRGFMMKLAQRFDEKGLPLA